MGLRIVAPALLWGAALVARAFAGDAELLQQTTRDRVYSKEQAIRGAELYATHCERCHTPEKVPAGKKPGPPVMGPKFFVEWQDRPLGALFVAILTTMPSDASATLTPDQTLDVVAHLLQLNGLPDGQTALKNDDAMRATVIVK